MESSRRASRVVIDPKVRQVGFVTPGTEPVAVAATAAQDAAAANSPSPVMIPPAPSRLTDAASPPKARPVPIASRKISEADEEVPLGSYYNPSDSVLSGTSTKTEADGQEFELSASVVTKLNSSLMEMNLDKASSTEAVLETPTASTQSPPEPKKLKEKTSRAERRALQEAQRAAKAASRTSGPAKADSTPKPPKKDTEKKPPSASAEKKQSQAEKKSVPSVAEKEKKKDVPEKEKKKEVPAPRMQFDDEHRVAKLNRRSLVEHMETKHRVELFRHLPQYVHAAQLQSLEKKFLRDEAMHIHPAVYQVGLNFLTWDVVGGNARCVAMLMAFREVISDHSTPPEKSITRDLTATIKSHVSFLITCRPLSISMGNAIRFLKQRIGKLPVTLTEQEAKSHLITQLDNFMQEKIVLADKEIVKHAVSKIRDGDVLLTHGSSQVVEMILSHANKAGKNFRVVIVDSRPRLEGRELLRKLLAQGIACTYTHLNALSYVMPEVTKVFLGAASVLANGTVYSRVGTAATAMVAHAFQVPVMICCETYKFDERVQLDSICSNELGDPDALVKVVGKDLELSGWSDNEHLQLLNLLYDATPADYVSMIITELGMVPPTSVPVILREYRKEPFELN